MKINVHQTIIRWTNARLTGSVICRMALLLSLFPAGMYSRAQTATVDPGLLSKRWTAEWITCPGVVQRAYGVYHFRKKIKLLTVPPKFLVHVTADNRYRLFVNGKPVCFGPALGDLYNWYFETVDLAPYLQPGDNLLAASVWNMGEFSAVNQVSNQTGFLLQGNGAAEAVVNTNAGWRVYKDPAYQPCSTGMGPLLKTYYALGPGDHFTAAKYPWGWETQAFDDKSWLPAEKISGAAVPLGYGTDNRWTLVPRTIPMMEQSVQRMAAIRQWTGLDSIRPFIKGNMAQRIPAGTTVSLLIDQSVNSVAYPVLEVSGGKGAVIRISYAEALTHPDGSKGNRSEVEGKQLAGNYDIFEPDGGSQRTFSPLVHRTFRYIRLDIRTADEPLTINDCYSIFTAYPFKENATFTCSDPVLKEIWQVGWRTARLCAGESYFDCPYYEQLQYVADTRIQALISLHVSGDDRLMKKAINDFYNSRVPEGLTQGRYPSNRLQVIPPFSLYWVSMLHDYLMYRNDDAFLSRYLVGVTGVLDWYEKRIDPRSGMLGPMKWWNFTDWTAQFKDMGVPPGATNGHSAILTLHYAYTLRQAAALFRHFDKQDQADRYAQLADQLAKATYARCYDAQKGLLADMPGKASFSQHVNILAVLADAVPKNRQPAIIEKILEDTSLTQASFYYRFYLFQAMKKAGLGNRYHEQLKPWVNMLRTGLTTFAETPDPSRSDCHAWSASPNYDFLATICGIMPIAPHFEKVKIEPALGPLSSVSGTMPVPAGTLSVAVVKNAQVVKATVILPASLFGIFVWAGKQYVLKPGHNVLELKKE